MIQLRTILYSVAIIAITLTMTSGASAMPNVKYLANFRSDNAVCLAFVNGIRAFRSTITESGTVSTGSDVSTLLENGANEISIWFGPIDENRGTLNFSKHTSCSFEITAATPSDSLLLTSVTAEANEDLAPTAQKSIYYNGTDITSPISERELSHPTAYEVTRTVTLKELPEWAWTKATPFDPTSENMQKLKDAYLDIWMAMDRKDIYQMQTLTELSVQEEASHEEMDPNLFFNSYDFKHDFERSKGGVPIDFSKFSLKSYCNGRMIQLQDKYGNSPLMLKLTNSLDGPVVKYKPYLSLIDGKIIITR